MLGALCREKGVTLTAAFDLKAYKESQYDALAQGIREHLALDLIYRILEKGI